MAIEVEKRAIVSEAEYNALLGLLRELGAEDIGANDTDSTFFLADDCQVKVQRLVSKRQAKVAWKSGGNNGATSREEIELPFSDTDFDKAELLIKRLMPQAQVFPTSQKRHDYKLGSLSIAVKYSDDWGYHVELDTEVADEADVPEALAQIEELATKLGLQCLTQQQEKEHVANRIAARQKKG